MNWFEISVEASHEASEAAYAVMSQHASGGVSIEEPVSQEADGENARVDYDRPVTLRAYIPIDGAEAATARAIEERLYLLSRIDVMGIGHVTTRELKEEDWASAWKAHYHIRKVGRRLVIKPSWLDHEPAPDEVVVELDPGMAFGTGLHPTTDTCLQLLEDLVRGSERVLDLGTGSGILSLAAAGLGSGPILALDVEPIAVETAAANARRAGLDSIIQVSLGSLPHPVGKRQQATGNSSAGDAPTQHSALSTQHFVATQHSALSTQYFVATQHSFDLVLANIIARVLIDLAPELAAVLAPGGRLLASGIIVDKEPGVLAAFGQAGLTTQRRVQSGDWVTLVLARPLAGFSPG